MDKAVRSARMQKWAGIIQEAATCGMPKTEYCARKGIRRRHVLLAKSNREIYS